MVSHHTVSRTFERTCIVESLASCSPFLLCFLCTELEQSSPFYFPWFSRALQVLRWPSSEKRPQETLLPPPFHPHVQRSPSILCVATWKSGNRPNKECSLMYVFRQVKRSSKTELRNTIMTCITPIAAADRWPEQRSSVRPIATLPYTQTLLDGALLHTTPQPPIDTDRASIPKSSSRDTHFPFQHLTITSKAHLLWRITMHHSNSRKQPITHRNPSSFDNEDRKQNLSMCTFTIILLLPTSSNFQNCRRVYPCWHCPGDPASPTCQQTWPEQRRYREGPLQ